MLRTDTELHRLTTADVFRMVEVGVLREEDRVELIDGVLVDVIPPGSRHSACVAWLTNHFVGAVGDREVRIQDLLLVDGGFVMPDAMVIDPVPVDRHPTTAALVIEVAATSQRHDTAKAAKYARAGVDEYWIADLRDRTLAVHRLPAADSYGDLTRHTDGDSVPTHVGAPPVPVTALFGPRR